MIKSLLYLFSFIFIINFSSAQTYKQVKIYLSDHDDVNQLYLAGLDFDHPHLTKDNAIIVFIDEDDYALLKSSGFNYEVLIEDWIEYYENLPVLSDAEREEVLSQTQRDFSVSGFGFGSMGGFYTFDEAIAELDTMFMLYPDIITEKVSIGTSIDGRQIYMVKISDNPGVSESEPQVLYTALHHAREPESMMQMIYFMYFLLENYSTNAEAQYLIDNREMYFIPVLNPDGYEYNRQTDPNGGGMWRKNRRNNGGSYGVDLNRNYGPYEYWNAPNGGSSTDPSSDTYRGTAPFSEPETAAIRDFLASKNLKNALNYHTYSNLLIYPYGALEHETADSLIFREFASDMTIFNGYVYGTDQQTVGYSTRGNSDDYYYDGDTLANGGKIFAMTPEVGSYSDGFWPPQSRIIPLAEENVFPNLYYAWVAGGYVTLEDPNYSQGYFNPGDVVELSPIFKNKGLSDASNINIELNSLNSLVTIENGTSVLSNIPSRETAEVTTPLSFSISSIAPIEEEIELEFVTSFGTDIMRKDTVKFIIGIPTFVFVDTTNDPTNLWTITATPSNPKWEATYNTFYSEPTSFTDSKNGNYSNDATVTMTLTNAIDISSYSNPRLSFQTMFDVESNWDYGQVEVSTNNGASWIPLEGEFTEPGVGSFQPNGEPVYDGTQSSWVKEEISLSAYLSDQFKVRFRLRTDGGVTRDGWYVDDIGIIVYSAPVVNVPLNLHVHATGPVEIELNWEDNNTQEDGFKIERKIGINGAFTLIDSVGENVTIYTDPFLAENIWYYYRVFAYQGQVNSGYSNIDSAQTQPITGKEEIQDIVEYELGQNYPNPFNPTTTISYSIEQGGHVNLTVYNLLGSEVAVLVDKYQSAGRHSIEFSTENLINTIGSGIYLYTLKAGSFYQTRKMILLR